MLKRWSVVGSLCTSINRCGGGEGGVAGGGGGAKGGDGSEGGEGGVGGSDGGDGGGGSDGGGGRGGGGASGGKDVMTITSPTCHWPLLEPLFLRPRAEYPL